MKQLVYILILVSISSLANSAHLLRGGRGALSNNSATFVGLIPETELVDGLLRSSYALNLNSSHRASMADGSERIYTVPSQCFTLFFSDFELFEYESENEACEWHFNEGEHLHMHGFMDHYIAASVDQAITWTIFNEDGYEKEFTSPDVSLVDELGIEILLHVDPPADLLVGEYQMTAQSSQFAPNGFVFYEYFFNNEELCFDNDPIFGNECYVDGGILGDGSEFINTSAASKLSILAVPVSAPLSSGFLAFGMLALYLQRFTVAKKA